MKPTLEATAYHEAGHMVAAWRQHLKIRRATIIPAEDYTGRVEHESPLRGIRLDIDGSDRAALKAEKAILICLAGPAAQRRFRRSSWRTHHGAGDHEIASDLALRLQGSGKIATAYLGYLQLRADSLVESNWNFVELFAQRLLELKTLEYREIRYLIDEFLKARRPVIRIGDEAKRPSGPNIVEV
jgi:ATP-dependent Zn protease